MHAKGMHETHSLRSSILRETYGFPYDPFPLFIKHFDLKSNKTQL